MLHYVHLPSLTLIYDRAGSLRALRAI
jgi:hypothetical protein